MQKVELPEPTTDCCESLNCLFPVDAQNEIRLLARFLSYSGLVCLLFFWLRNAPLHNVIGNPISVGSLLLTSPCSIRIIKRVQKSLKRFWWPSGAASWLVSLSYYCIWCVIVLFFFFWFPKVERSFCAKFMYKTMI